MMKRCSPSLQDGLQFLDEHTSSSVVLVQVTSVSDGSVALDTGASLPYDYLVLAPGSTYPEPALKGFTGSFAERSATMQVLLLILASLTSELDVGMHGRGAKSAMHCKLA